MFFASAAHISNLCSFDIGSNMKNFLKHSFPAWVLSCGLRHINVVRRLSWVWSQCGIGVFACHSEARCFVGASAEDLFRKKRIKIRCTAQDAIELPSSLVSAAQVVHPKPRH